MHSGNVEMEVRRVLAVWMQVERELTEPLPLPQVLALHTQAEVLAGRLRRMRRELRSALNWLEAFEPTSEPRRHAPPTQRSQTSRGQWRSLAEMVVRAASAA